MASIRIVLDNRPKKYKLHDLKISVYMNGTMSVQSIGLSIPKSIWNEKKEEVIKDFEGKPKGQINKFILSWKVKAFELLSENQNLTASDFIGRLFNRKEGQRVVTYLDSFIDRLKKQGRHGNMKVYSDTKAVLERFCKLDVKLFSEIDYNFIKEFDEFMISEGMKPNSRAFYHSKLRSLLNHAAKETSYQKGNNPYLDFKLPRQRTAKRNLDLKDVRKIANVDSLATDVFMFSFYQAGIDIVDIAYMNPPSDRLTYYRKKSNQLVDVILTPQGRKILDKYKGRIPILTDGSPEEVYRKYLWKRNRINIALSKIVQGATTKTARHTWATMAKREGVSKEMISEILGHAPTSVTDIYLDSFEREEKDKVVLKIADLV